MAKVYVSEYASVTRDGRGLTLPCGSEPAVAQQTLTSSGTSGQSSAFNASTRLIRVHTDGIISIAIGSNPTASVNAQRMAAGQTEYFGVQAGHKIAVITNT